MIFMYSIIISYNFCVLLYGKKRFFLDFGHTRRIKEYLDQSQFWKRSICVGLANSVHSRLPPTYAAYKLDTVRGMCQWLQNHVLEHLECTVVQWTRIVIILKYKRTLHNVITKISESCDLYVAKQQLFVFKEYCKIISRAIIVGKNLLKYCIHL